MNPVTNVYQKTSKGLLPLGQVVPNIDERVRNLENYPTAVLVTKPTIEGGLNLPLNSGSIQFTVSAESLLPDTRITRFEYTIDNQTQSVEASGGSATFRVSTPEGAKEDDTYTLLVRAYNDAYASNSNSVILKVVSVGVATPTLSGQTVNVVKGEASFTGSEFTVIGADGVHDKSDWVLFEKEFSSIETWSSKDDGTNLTTVPQEINEALESDREYILKLRYHDATTDLWSDFGSIEFNTASIAVTTPTISGSAIDVMPNTTFTASAFNLVGAPSGNHDKTDWVLVKTSSPLVEVWSSKDDTENLTTSPSIPKEVLVESTNYTLKVRYHDSTYNIWSDWGKHVFTTASVFLTAWCPNAYTEGIHFKASSVGSNINFFSGSAPAGCVYEVWINNAKTEQAYNSITFNANDDVLIKVVQGDKFPKFTASTKDYIKEVLEPLPLLSDSMGNAVTTLSSCFQSCSSLTSIPERLFDNNTAVTSFGNCFRSCSGLTSIPEGLFDNNTTTVTDLNGCFYSCTGLTSIPEGLFDNNTAVTSFNNCFINCSGLTSIPEGLFDNNTAVTSFSACFQNCTSLTSIPERLFDNNTAVTTFGSCFQGCSSLTLVVHIGSSGVTSAANFSYRTEATGTVYVPRGSTTYSTFNSAAGANVNVIQE